MCKLKFFFLFVFFVPFLLCAQSENDSCIDAKRVLISDTYPYRTCVEYLGNMDRETVNEDYCGYEDPNVWYSFIARYPSVNIRLKGTTVPSQLQVFSFTDDPCLDEAQVDYGNCVEDHFISFTAQPGTRYYISVSFDFEFVDEFQLCVQNAAMPDNEDVCAPLILEEGITATRSILGASPADINSACSEVSITSSIWFSYEMPAQDNDLNLLVEPTDPSLEYTTRLFRGDGSCSYSDQAVLNTCKSGIMQSRTYLDEPHNLYYLELVIDNDQMRNRVQLWDDFSVTVTSEQRVPCADNVDCRSADTISVELNGPEVCFTGCNTGLPPIDTQYAECFDPYFGAAWYRIYSENEQWISWSVSSTEIANPVVYVLEGECGNLVERRCIVGANGFTEFRVFAPEQSTMYFLISDELGAQGPFDVCVSAERSNLICALEQNLYVSRRVSKNGTLRFPLEGPFCPGDSVTFEYQVASWDQNIGCQWLQAMVPNFGKGWNIAPQDTPIFEPIVPYAGGQWGWYQENEIDYNLNNPRFTLHRDCKGRLGLCELRLDSCQGDALVGSGKAEGPGNPGLPAGWYAWDCADGQNGCGDPDFDWGDGQGCSSLSGPWVVRFTLIASDKQYCQQPDCGVDCSVSMVSFADQEIGNWEGTSVCIDDDMIYFNGQLNCTELPAITIAEYDTITSQGQLNLNIGSSDSLFLHGWEAVNGDTCILGATSGTGDVIKDILVNDCDSVSSVSYRVYVQTAGGCFNDTTITVFVRPAKRLSYSLQWTGSACAPHTVTYANNSKEGIYASYEWLLPESSNSQTLEESPTTIYQEKGAYDVCLIGYREDGGVDSLMQERSTVVNDVPEGRIEYNLSGNRLTLLYFGTLLDEYAWDVNGLETDERTPVLFLDTVGEYTIQLDGRNECGTSTFETTFLFGDSTDVSSAIRASAADCIQDGVTFSIDINASISSVTWQFEGGTPSSSAELQPVVVFDSSGVYDISFEATLDVGFKHESSESVLLDFVPAPTSDFSYDQMDATIFCTNRSVDADTYFWEFGDGATSTLKEPEHTYLSSGNYQITCTALSECGQSVAIDSVSVLILSNDLDNELGGYFGLRPNPSNGPVELVWQGAENEVTQVDLYTLEGKLVQSQRYDQLAVDNQQWNTTIDADVPEGVYFIRVQQGTKSWIGKWVKL